MPSLHRSWMFAVAILLASAAALDAREEPRAPAPVQPYACETLETGRLVLRHPPIPADYAPGMPRGEIACRASIVTEALRRGQPVFLENVILTGLLDLRDAGTRTVQGKLPLGRRIQPDALQHWLDERRRLHLIPDALAIETFFVPVTAPVVIRGGRRDELEAGPEPAPLLFLEEVDLRGTRVLHGMNFAGATFRGPVAFEGAVIDGRVLFNEAHFDAGVDFTRTRFAPDTRFDRATFAAAALRRASRSPRPFPTLPAVFMAADFPNLAMFRGVVFESLANFQKAAFGGPADFATARFQARADFAHATFAGPLDASNAIFVRDALFPNVAFAKPATFRRAEFRQLADFGLATFADRASSFRDAVFGRPLVWRSGYDFRYASFADKVRTLARGRFDVHSGFAVITVLAAGLGLIVCLGLRRQPMLAWRPAPDDSEAVITIIPEPRPWLPCILPRLGQTSPHRQFKEMAFLLIALAVLVFGLAVHYHAHVQMRVDGFVRIWYPMLFWLIWTGGVVAIAAAISGVQFRRSLTKSEDPPPRPEPRLDYFDRSYHVWRVCDHTVREFVGRVSTGMLGLAGRRGVGRSTLARAVLAEIGQPRPRDTGNAGSSASFGSRPQVLAVDVPSPPRDSILPFFLVLFRRVGEEARRDLRHQRLFEVPPDLAAADRERLITVATELLEQPPTLMFTVFGLGLVSALPYLAYVWRPPSTPDGGFWDWVPTLLLGGVLAFAVCYYARAMSQWALRRRLMQSKRAGVLYVRTERALERLAYEEATSEDKEGTLSAFQGLVLRVRRGRALKERAQTLAAILDDFTDYVKHVRAVYPGGVVIHVDEADRIEDQAGIRDLLTGLKATLVSGLLYVIPLPEAASEGRPLRSAGGGAGLEGLIDDVVFVPPMTVAEALRMLKRRNFFGVPDDNGGDIRQAVGLAICLASGGIAKSVLRLARRAIAEGDHWTPRDVLARMWDEEIVPTREALARSAAVAPEAKTRMLSAIASMSADNWTERIWRALHAELICDPTTPEAVGTARRELADALVRLEWRQWAGTRLNSDLGRFEKVSIDLVGDARIGQSSVWDVGEELEGLRAAFLSEGVPRRPAVPEP